MSTTEANPLVRTVASTQSEMTEIILPNDANTLGNLLGGRLMHFIDLTGAMAAYRHSRTHVVTAAMDHIDFIQPVHVGDLLTLKSSVNRAFTTSMEVGRQSLGRRSANRHASSCCQRLPRLRRHRRARPPAEGAAGAARNTRRDPPLCTMLCAAASIAKPNQRAASRSASAHGTEATARTQVS